MKILLNGVETNNKGAELMLYSILQEIERKYPNATVYIPESSIFQGFDFVKTTLDFRPVPQSAIEKTARKFHVPGILIRIKIPYKEWTDFKVMDDIDYFIDGSGFSFSDQWGINKLKYNLWKHYLEGYRKKGTKIIFLPQAFGPAENPWTKKILNLVTENAEIVFPREKVSYDYLINAGCDKSKLNLKTDFTSLTKGVFPEKYNHLSGKVAIIPNLRMVDKGTISLEAYLDLMNKLIELIRQSGHDAFLLNHEGPDDESLCYKIQERVGDIEVVTKLNALEVKGLIASSYLCITSRFHGVASALNSCVPCLATSWSHKYAELYHDYGITDAIINLSDWKETEKKVLYLLNPENNQAVRNHLKGVVPKIQQETREMWDIIWSLC